MIKSKVSKKKQGGAKSKKTTSIMPRSFRYPLVADQQRVALRWSGTFETNVSSFVYALYGVAGPGTRIPKYWDQYFGIYKYAYIESVSFKFEIVNVKDDCPLRVVLAETNSQDVVPTTFLELAETPRAVQKISMSDGNRSVVILNKSTKSQAIMGHKLEDDEAYWCTKAAGPTAPILPMCAVAFEPIVSGSGTHIAYLVTINYSIKFFTLNHL